MLDTGGNLFILRCLLVVSYTNMTFNSTLVLFFVQLYVGVTLLHCCHLFQIKHHRSVLGFGCCVGTAQVIKINLHGIFIIRNFFLFRICSTSLPVSFLSPWSQGPKKNQPWIWRWIYNRLLLSSPVIKKTQLHNSLIEWETTDTTALITYVVLLIVIYSFANGFSEAVLWKRCEVVAKMLRCCGDWLWDDSGARLAESAVFNQ